MDAPTLKVFTPNEFWDLVEDPEDPEYNLAIGGLVDKIAARGDYVVVYRNDDLGHPGLGTVKVLSFGSEASYLEAAKFNRPPQTLPDTPSEINWRYQLVGIYGPGQLPELVLDEIERKYPS